MSEVTERIVRIKSTMLGYESHGILTAYVELDYGGAMQIAGGYGFDRWDEERQERVVDSGFGLAWVAAMMRAAGVEKWEDVAGRTLFALCEGEGFGTRVHGFAPLPTEPGKRFLFDDLAAEFYPDRVRSGSAAEGGDGA